jgi:integrase
MAGHIQDRWYKTEKDANGKPRRAKTDRHGTGMRYRARYVGPDGTEKSQSFPDRQKRQADEWLATIEADMSRGRYIDPKAGQITFRQYAEKWLNGQSTSLTTQHGNERHLRLHAYPHFGSRPLASFQPIHIKTWLAVLDNDPGVSGGYARNIFATVRAAFSAAVDDELIARNPCRARTIAPPKAEPRRIVPWRADRVFAVQAALPEEFRATVDLGGGCGLRQGEIIGCATDVLNLEAEVVHVVRQIKQVRGTAVFAPPKGGKLRDVPLSPHVAARLKAHMELHPPVKVTLPWLRPDGPPVTFELLFSNSHDGVAHRANFNIFVWKPALAAAGVIATPKPGMPYPSAREDGMHALRHFYASVLLHEGTSIKALSEYLGHSDPGFTLRTYTHLMPDSQDRARRAVDGVFPAPPEPPDGPETAQR